MPEEVVAMRQMPRYKCHKEVWALKIKEVKIPVAPIDNPILAFEDEGYLPIEVDYDYIKKHNPTAGGYYVVYDDGYRSFSPAKPFEDGYSRIS